MSYALGTTDPPTDIEELLGTTALTGKRAPQDTFYEASVFVDRADGLQSGHGYPTVTWRFGVLSQAMIDNLRAICPGRSAEVYLTTRNADGDFATYQGVMIWPQRQADARQAADKFVGLEFTFRRLEEVV